MKSKIQQNIGFTKSFVKVSLCAMVLSFLLEGSQWINNEINFHVKQTFNYFYVKFR